MFLQFTLYASYFIKKYTPLNRTKLPTLILLWFKEKKIFKRVIKKMSHQICLCLYFHSSLIFWFINDIKKDKSSFALKNNKKKRGKFKKEKSRKKNLLFTCFISFFSFLSHRIFLISVFFNFYVDIFLYIYIIHGKRFISSNIYQKKKRK